MIVYVSERIAELLERRPAYQRLRLRRWSARFGTRIESAHRKRENGWRGDHRRWTEEGRQALDWSEYKAREGITDEQEVEMREEMPF